MKKIKELQKRKSLNEGRDYGIGFSILKKLDNNNYETYLPFTACRDYLNDFSYVEYTKNEISSVYGYNHKLLNCFNNKKVFYLGVKTLNFNNGNIWNNKVKAEKILLNNYKILEIFLNRIENQLGLKIKTSIMLDEDTLIFKAPIYWTKTTALISVYTLMIRCFFNIVEEDLSLPIDVFFEKHQCFIQEDQYMKKHCINFFNNIDKINFKNINYSQLRITDKYCVHNFGIQNFLNKNNIK